MSDLTEANDEQLPDIVDESMEVEIEEPDGILQEMTEEQQQEAEEFAVRFIKSVLRLRGVRIDRAHFLKAELHKRGFAPEVIEQAIAGTPVSAGVTQAVLDEIASASIGFETRKSSAISFAAGVPGGLVMLASVPGDITQFYVHAFRVMQKLAYTYGWQSLLQETQDIDDETLGKLASLLGVMMGVGVASGAVTGFATNVARPAVQKQISRVALTKTTWYGPMKQVLRIVGVKVTKDSFAKSVTKAIPVVGGVVSGGMTWVVLDTQSKRLMRHLREIPPPNVDAAAYLAELRRLDEEDPARTKSVVDSMRGAVSGTAARFRPADTDEDEAQEESRVKAAMKGVAAKAKDAASSASDSLAGAAKRVREFDEEHSVSQSIRKTGGAAYASLQGAVSGTTRKLSPLFQRKKKGEDAPADAETDGELSEENAPGADAEEA